MGVLLPAGATAATPGPAALTSVSWEPAGQLELSEWLAYGRRFGAIGRGINWWIGDWVRYGNACYGERYSRAVRATGYDAQSLMNMAYVASRFEPARRRGSLSWSHHAELAALEWAEQERWLAFVELERLSVHSLRLELRAARRAADAQGAVPAHGAEAAAEDRSQIVCPRCRHVIGLPAEHAAS